MEQKNKVALMTWFTYKNYGSALQAGALYNTVCKMGYQPEFIDYAPKGVIQDTSRLDLIGRLFKKLKSHKIRNYSSKGLDALYDEYYGEKFVISQPCNSYAELYDLNDKYLAFICGSDQIWAPICYDSKYFLDFVKNVDKMIAYAPSIGCSKIDNPTVKTNMSRLISRFKNLSVREQKGAELISELTGQTAKVVLDPTLLMNSNEWDEYISEEKVQRISGEYIVGYFLGEADKYMKYVKELSKKLGLPYYVIPVTEKQKGSGRAIPFEVGPKEFVSLIKNATHVCTDSFHGLAFSINYNVPFTVFKRFKDNDPKNQNSRIFNLLKITGLENRLADYKRKVDIDVSKFCDFSKANKSIEIRRKDSKEYLKNALEQAKTSVGSSGDKYVITNTCCGCGACSSICKQGAITIKKDEEGFEKYCIDTEKCVRCGLCKTVCPMINISAPILSESKALYSVKSCSEQVLKKSSSGGTAYELALYLIENGYSICGCTYDRQNDCARHIWIRPNEKERLSLLQGSKYVQSITKDALKEIDKESDEGKVAFFGTPCQCTAVDKLLRRKNKREESIVVDLICHGVPSAFLWKKYLQKIEKGNSVGQHPQVYFRCKDKGWRNRFLKVEGKGKVYKKSEHADDFYAFFRRGLCYMEACFDCPYRQRSSADIRVGDYWGNKFEKDKQGVSMVISNTQNGDALIQQMQRENRCKVEKQQLIEYWKVQFPYNARKPLIREELIKEDRKSVV